MLPDDSDLGVICTNEWSQRQLLWLRTQVGDAVIREAVMQLPSGRRPWPLNVARHLGLQLPERLAVDPRTPTAFFAAAKLMLTGKKGG